MSSQGQFDITAQKDTYKSFIKFATFATIILVSILSVMGYFLL